MSFEIPYEALFPGVRSTDTITGHDDTVHVGDIVDVFFHQNHGLRVQEFTAIKIVGIDGETIYHEIPGHPEALPGQFAVGQTNGGWWRTFKQSEVVDDASQHA